MWTRFLPVVRKVVERVEQGKIGRVTGFDGAFTMPLRLIKPFISDRVYKAEYVGGAILPRRPEDERDLAAILKERGHEVIFAD